MTFWFYFTCIKISPRQTISSRSLASTLNLTCANDVTTKNDTSVTTANNKGTDQLAHPRSLISAFAIYKLNSIAFKLAPSETSIFYLVSVAEKAGFGMILSETLKTGFVASMLIYAFIFM